MRVYRSPRRFVEARSRLLAPFALAAVALTVGGCGLSMPIGGLGLERETTGSLQGKPISPLSSDLGVEDWRRAKGALAIALDPVGSGTQVAWDNPETGLKGIFVPVGSPFVKADEICRSFRAAIKGRAETRTVQGTACRVSGAEWAIQDVKPGRKPV